MHPDLDSAPVAQDHARVWRTPSIQLERVAVPARLRLRGHGHDEPHLCFVAAGELVERDGAARHRVAHAGTLRGSPAGDEHDLTFRAPSRCLLVLFAGGAIEPPSPAERCWVVQAHAQRLASELDALVDDEHASPLDVELVALELMAAAMRGPERATGPWLVRVRDRIADAPATPPSTRDLAHEAGLHPIYVARAFRRAFGMGIGDYARLVRAEHARRMLAESGIPLAELALRAGYADQSHLTRDMRRFLGATPVAVRRGAGRMHEVAAVQDAHALATPS